MSDGGEAGFKEDRMEFRILEDGTIRVTVDEVSGANHASADALVGMVSKLAGGQTTIKRRGDSTHNHHTHTHQHVMERVKK